MAGRYLHLPAGVPLPWSLAAPVIAVICAGLWCALILASEWGWP